MRYAVYKVLFRSGISQDNLRGRVQNLLSKSAILRPHQKKKDKTYDLRPLVDSLGVQSENGTVVLDMKLRAGQEGNARASEVLDELGLDDRQFTISRLNLLFDEPVVDAAG